MGRDEDGFVAGIEDIGSVSFSVTPDGTIEGARGSSFATFTWNSPLPGRHSFTVSGGASRGLGGKDRASVQFEINVQPASFVSQPGDHGFWGVPYTFDGQIVGLKWSFPYRDQMINKILYFVQDWQLLAA